METKTNMQANTQTALELQNNKGINLKIDANITGSDENESFNLHISGDYNCKNPSVYDWYHNSHKHSNHHGNHKQQPQQHNNYCNCNQHPQQHKNTSSSTKNHQQQDEYKLRYEACVRVQYKAVLETAESIEIKEHNGSWDLNIKLSKRKSEYTLGSAFLILNSFMYECKVLIKKSKDDTFDYIKYSFNNGSEPLWMLEIAKDEQSMKKKKNHICDIDIEKDIYTYILSQCETVDIDFVDGKYCISLKAQSNLIDSITNILNRVFAIEIFKGKPKIEYLNDGAYAVIKYELNGFEPKWARTIAKDFARAR